ncbi:hypothetical protein [Rhodovulum euryhalinum]|uniref:Uncharacterized protein n=1 Tax=Rhodovulum euryhalinum TaxID=35805 RepID=A0A4R2KUX3_9RHOB|nr:hypothetical protein [Rhodovulum euryhalinum]TCO70515.1 hypothetical protein EV655_10962 [Rhodovulum euryhalinum]
MHGTVVQKALATVALTALVLAPQPGPVLAAAPLPQMPAVGIPGVTRTTATAATTDRIVRQIEAARDFCGRIAQREYTIDCLAAALDRVARDMPGGDYDAAGRIIGRTARDLRRLAEANADPALPRGRVRVGDTLSPRALTPVRRDALGPLGDRAAALLQEAETELLRAVEGSARRMIHYQRIAAAVGSAKVLMRSI